MCFDWRASRRHAEATTLLKNFKGVLQADGYAAYDALAAERAQGEITRLGCLAHARRKVFEAQGEDLREAKLLLRFIIIKSTNMNKGLIVAGQITDVADARIF